MGWKEMDADVYGQKSIPGQQGPAITDGSLGTVPASSLSYRNLLQAARLNHCHTAVMLPRINNVLSPSPGHAVTNCGSLWQTVPPNLHLFSFCPGDALHQQIGDRDEEKRTLKTLFSLSS